MTRRSRSGRRRLWARQPYLSDAQVTEFFATVDKFRQARLCAEPAYTSAQAPHPVISEKSWSPDDNRL